MIVICENPWGALTLSAPWGDKTPGSEGLRPDCQGGDRMDYWNVDHTVVRQRQQGLQRETENRRLVRALRESRKGAARAGRAVEEVDQYHAEEGVALVTHHPEILRNSNCFSLLGSRRGDRRVTALWISKGKPRLGWCWAGNPHTWLGSASCGSRVGLGARGGTV